jgi:tRNA threonylcarbamoyladenosine biosynthesis protein TsaE
MSDAKPLAEAISIYLADKAATAALGRTLAHLARAGDVIALTGELGSGKTALARAFINALPRPDGRVVPEDVPSPTFTLVQTYARRQAMVWHFDLYRIGDPDEIDELGWDEALDEGIILVEWPERLGRRLPRDHLDLLMTFPEDGEGRLAILQAAGDWAERLKELQELE